ncbi:hypothetical protein CUZ56_00739 [Saezia sanguinis]|uniref:Uncharacterized protein n=1 Tax=Saezia sanguinis TaxID=1965230 RepID=A0A433SHN1_9BURK|nr:hypothetical protein [Saezia sanguinis]RUS68251.1 hypothetical protein CUZ56_00739 [Saezia sanguinis]
MKMSLTKKGLAAAFAALGMFSLISTVHAQTEPYYAGAASADISTGRVTGTLDQLCHFLVKDRYEREFPSGNPRFIDAKFAWFASGKQGDNVRKLACSIKDQYLRRVDGVMIWYPPEPVFPDIPSSPWGPALCNEYNGTGLYADRDGCWWYPPK